jgi:hypothetical protein
MMLRANRLLPDKEGPPRNVECYIRSRRKGYVSLSDIYSVGCGLVCQLDDKFIEPERRLSAYIDLQGSGVRSRSSITLCVEAVSLYEKSGIRDSESPGLLYPFTMTEMHQRLIRLFVQCTYVYGTSLVTVSLVV